MKNVFILIFSFYFLAPALSQKDHDTIISQNRIEALANWDFQMADLLFGQLSKDFKDSNNLKRKWLNNINFQPQVNSVTDFDISGPFVGFNFGFGIHPSTKWGIQQQFNSQGVRINNIRGDQGDYNLSSNYRINKKWELKFNFHSLGIQGNRFQEDTLFIEDTINIVGPVVNKGNRIQSISGPVNKGSNTSTIGLVRHAPTFRVGGFLSVRNSYLNDSLTETTIDSLRQTNGSNYLGPVYNHTQNSQHEFTSVNYHQLSLFGEWNPTIYNSGLRFTSWIEVPFQNKRLGFSPFFQTELLLTSNTWIGGWIRDYSNSIEPIENAGLIQNFSYDEVYLKYGGFVNYQKSNRWWVKFNIEIQRRKAFQSTYKYSTLSLGFKFTYRLI